MARTELARVWLAAIATAGTLSACASGQPSRPVAAATGPAPLPVAGYDWFLNADGEESHLAYGVAESDDVPISLSCRSGSGRLEVTATAPVGAREIRLESGGDTENFTAISEPDVINDGVYLTAQAQADTPVFLRFRRVGWLALWQDGQRRPLVPQPQSLARIEQFFRACG